MKNLLIFTAVFLISGNIFGQDNGITIPETNDYKYDSLRTNHLAVNYTAFHSNDADEYSFVFSTFNEPYKVFRGGPGDFGYASAPIDLPNGVTITKLTAYVYDNSSLKFLRLRLIESTYGGSNVTQATIETTAANMSPLVKELESVPISVTIDNSAKSYQLRFASNDSSTNIPSIIRLYGVKIEYTTSRAQ